eukprot:3346524-Amphidinium_carterae.3
MHAQGCSTERCGGGATPPYIAVAACASHMLSVCAVSVSPFPALGVHRSDPISIFGQLLNCGDSAKHSAPMHGMVGRNCVCVCCLASAVSLFSVGAEVASTIPAGATMGGTNVVSLCKLAYSPTPVTRDVIGIHVGQFGASHGVRPLHKQ